MAQRAAEESAAPSETKIVALCDKGGRRVGFERRRYSYTCYIPERRRGEDRRSGDDRRRAARSRPLPAVEASHASEFQHNAAPR